jgi:hypothetical protein
MYFSFQGPLTQSDIFGMKIYHVATLIVATVSCSPLSQGCQTFWSNIPKWKTIKYFVPSKNNMQFCMHLVKYQKYTNMPFQEKFKTVFCE